jgi:predicted lipid-binding transport protein (Tim44 family)
MSGIERDDQLAQREADRAAAEAAAIGGRPSAEPEPVAGAADEAQRPLVEAGEGEAEGFEAAERELVEHASHGDQHAARRVVEDAPAASDELLANQGGEADHEHSAEREDDR